MTADSAPASAPAPSAPSRTPSGAPILTGSGVTALEDLPREQDAYPLDRVGRIAARLPADAAASPVYIRGAGAKPQAGFAVKHV